MGSPPQVRGKPNSTHTVAAARRITPAGAGKTPRRRLPPINPRDHPRRCGENIAMRLIARTIGGSPPQVRGKPLKRKLHCIIRRITPAGAGKTCLEGCFRQGGSGSPPQVRGKPIDRTQCCLPQRITPAGAGKTIPHRGSTLCH